MKDRSVLLFGLHRGGSSIAARLLQILLGGAGYRVVDDGERYYNAGYVADDIPQSVFQALESSGVCYGPFREYPVTMHLADISALTRIIVVRDPRDCLVSAYFAWQGLHDSADRLRKLDQLPTQRDAIDSVDDYCIRNAYHVRDRIESLRLLCLHYPDTLVFRYEDIFVDPARWLHVLIGKLGVEVPTASVDQARIEAVFEPAFEDPKRHRRQGRPGDHHRKLSRQTCLHLTEVFEKQLTFFAYDGVRPGMAARGVSADLVPCSQFDARDEIAALKRIIAELQTENGFRIDEIAQLKAELEPALSQPEMQH